VPAVPSRGRGGVEVGEEGGAPVNTLTMVPTGKLVAWCCTRLQELGIEVVVQFAPTGAP